LGRKGEALGETDGKKWIRNANRKNVQKNSVVKKKTLEGVGVRVEGGVGGGWGGGGGPVVLWVGLGTLQGGGGRV